MPDQLTPLPLLGLHGIFFCLGSCCVSATSFAFGSDCSASFCPSFLSLRSSSFFLPRASCESASSVTLTSSSPSSLSCFSPATVSSSSFVWSLRCWSSAPPVRDLRSCCVLFALFASESDSVFCGSLVGRTWGCCCCLTETNLCS